jgi:hypothetical protein
MIELPQASAGATFCAKVPTGALKGQMPAHTPHGWRSVYYAYRQHTARNILRGIVLAVSVSSALDTTSLGNLSIMFA